MIEGDLNRGSLNFAKVPFKTRGGRSEARRGAPSGASCWSDSSRFLHLKGWDS